MNRWVLAVLASLLPCTLHAHGNPPAEARASVAGKSVAIEYHRPSLKGRELAASLRVGDHWRMGADVPTTLETEGALAFGSTVVPAGEYVLTATRVADSAWGLTFHRPRWMFIRRWPFVITVPGEVVADVPLTMTSLPSPVELLTIELRGGGDRGELEMRWGTLALRTAFTAR